METEVPGNAGTSRHSPELVDYVARDKVDVVVIETEVSISDTLSPQLVQFGFLHPLSTLWGERGVWFGWWEGVVQY